MRSNNYQSLTECFQQALTAIIFSLTKGMKSVQCDQFSCQGNAWTSQGGCVVVDTRWTLSEDERRLEVRRTRKNERRARHATINTTKEENCRAAEERATVFFRSFPETDGKLPRHPIELCTLARANDGQQCGVSASFSLASRPVPLIPDPDGLIAVAYPHLMRITLDTDFNVEISTTIIMWRGRTPSSVHYQVRVSKAL